MNVSPKDYTIFIASHMKHENRLEFLIECLKSLIHQKLQIPIYLSISFENNELSEHFTNIISNIDFITNCGFLNICKRYEKTPQMLHYNLLCKEYGKLHKWVMFCDDDDSYQINRTLHFITIIENSIKQLEEGDSNLHLAGVYESTDNKHHRSKRHEYWCYCINMILLEQFMDIVEKYPSVLNDKCCDVLFGEYLRRKNNKWIFMQITDHYYNYRIENNTDSITGFIRSKQTKYSKQSKPPSEDSDEWANYVFEWNDYLHENIDIYLHDTYLRSLIGSNIDEIFKSEFLANYSLISYIDKDHIIKINDQHSLVRKVCDELYDIKLS